MAKITMTIEWDSESGRVDVKGPIGMKGLSHDMLDRAREIIDAYKPPADKGKVGEDKFATS